jgi:hypothetical protein
MIFSQDDYFPILTSLEVSITKHTAEMMAKKEKKSNIQLVEFQKYRTPNLGQPNDIPTTKSYKYECKTKGYTLCTYS